MLTQVAGETALRSKVGACGVAAARRLRFAPVVGEVGAHLHRVRIFGLVLDTPEYNCHTTGRDAWSSAPSWQRQRRPPKPAVGPR